MDKGKEKLVEPEVEVEDFSEHEDDVYRPSFVEDCPLLDEGGYEEDEEAAQFVSLANMCRGEQLFSEYFNELIGERDLGTEKPCEGSGTTAEKTNPEKHSRKKQQNTLVEERQVDTTEEGDAEMLNDTLKNCLRTTSDDEEEEGQGERKRKVRYQPFKLTDECPKWEVGDVFGDREYFREALRQYAVMSKRPIKTTKSDGKRYKAECKGNNCEWYVNLSRMSAYNPNDYVVTALQHKHSQTCTQVTNNKWISARWLGKRYTEKIKFNPHILMGSILQSVDEDFSSKLSRMKAYRARTIALGRDLWKNWGPIWEVVSVQGAIVENPSRVDHRHSIRGATGDWAKCPSVLAFLLLPWSLEEWVEAVLHANHFS